MGTVSDGKGTRCTAPTGSSEYYQDVGATHISLPSFIICEDATNGDLGSFLSRSEENKKTKWRLLHQAALGLDYIHQKGVVHGNLKLNNILVGDDGQAKLSDFSLKAMRSTFLLSKTVSSGSTMRWSAPECLKQRPSEASDVFSFAMRAIEAATGEILFAFLGDDDVRDNIRRGEIPAQPEEMSDSEWKLVISMTCFDPRKRVTLKHVSEKLKDFADKESAEDPEDPPNDGPCERTPSL
ncbi:hypothetical protein V7S43_008667 [Phytophthora oleae]|uniref:Protein kinase domain-containing protein n=1 Tax=Phytophthora oleae TaxID=2107226 RepID=A0ABD3FL22_9STRA